MPGLQRINLSSSTSRETVSIRFDERGSVQAEKERRTLLILVHYRIVRRRFATAGRDQISRRSAGGGRQPPGSRFRTFLARIPHGFRPSSPVWVSKPIRCLSIVLCCSKSFPKDRECFAFSMRFQDDLASWNREFLLGGQRIQLGFGYKEGGNVALGARVLVNDEIPVGAAVQTNVNSPKELKYEIGSGLPGKVAGIVQGDSDGAVKYAVRGELPVSVDGKTTRISASVLGDRLKLTAVGAGVNVEGDNLEALVGLNDKYVPESVAVSAGSNRIRL
ncbi:unnamed protein product [Nesidiocoris tenuis]|uniref:Uncharacterized protein n=1 Tax=Nesidiocoris tenuis TaxID=355587 RepID=A0A6H5H5D6_9HEMI|nr:unnamed protein product [Nesidiocoris tenuis]